MSQNNSASETAVSDSQQRAISALISGASISAAADSATVDRSTVHRWLRTDFTFVAELNRQRQDLRERIDLRLEAVTEAAIDVVAAAVHNGDVKAALALLRGTGALTDTRSVIGPTEARTLERTERVRLAESTGDPMAMFCAEHGIDWSAT